MGEGRPTKTTNPIHFEDLDPKRFEDLVRELTYDFRDWQTIEATGTGADGWEIKGHLEQWRFGVDVGRLPG